MRKESTISLFIPGDDKNQNKAGTMDLKTMGLLGDSERVLWGCWETLRGFSAAGL